jgi:hypothetical protein
VFDHRLCFGINLSLVFSIKPLTIYDMWQLRLSHEVKLLHFKEFLVNAIQKFLSVSSFG